MHHGGAMQKYDFIGDIHGEATMLRRLLARLGYSERGGAYGHPERRAVFLGDYVDRGPRIEETLQIIRRMVEHGAAIALLGNHELDAVFYATPLPGAGGWLRPHTEKNQEMQTATAAQFRGREREWRDWLDWFQTLPMWMETSGFRAVHACWNPASIERLRGAPTLAGWNLARAADETSPEGAAIRLPLKGPEIDLPGGVTVAGRMGRRFGRMRLRWWQVNRQLSYAEACINRYETGPNLPISTAPDDQLAPPAVDERPVFFGHYWLMEGPPAPVAANAACLDYGVAAGGPSVAYRWEGETLLDAGKFVAVQP